MERGGRGRRRHQGDPCAAGALVTPERSAATRSDEAQVWRIEARFSIRSKRHGARAPLQRSSRCQPVWRSLPAANRETIMSLRQRIEAHALPPSLRRLALPMMPSNTGGGKDSMTYGTYIRTLIAGGSSPSRCTFMRNSSFRIWIWRLRFIWAFVGSGAV